jgi:hypothetical protein
MSIFSPTSNNSQPPKSYEPKCESILVRGRVVLEIKPEWTSHLVCLLTRFLVSCVPFCRSNFCLAEQLKYFYWSPFGNPETPDFISYTVIAYFICVCSFFLSLSLADFFLLHLVCLQSLIFFHLTWVSWRGFQHNFYLI